MSAERLSEFCLWTTKVLSLVGNFIWVDGRLYSYGKNQYLAFHMFGIRFSDIILYTFTKKLFCLLFLVDAW